MLRSVLVTTALAGTIALCFGPGGMPMALAQTAPAAQIPDDALIGPLLPPVVTPGASRGINKFKPAPQMPVPAAAPAAEAPAPQAMRLPTTAPVPAEAGCRPGEQPGTVDCTMQFASGSAELPPAMRRELDQLGRIIARPPLLSYRFRIEGHTDTTGSVAINKTLSERRAAAVANYLSSRFGIAPDRLEPVGLGEDGLLVATGPQTPEPRNRRVVVVNIGT